jgi:ferredoxin
MAITVVASRCPQNHHCPSLQVCPVGALTQVGNAAPTVDEALCIDCGKCVSACPMGALVAGAAGRVAGRARADASQPNERRAQARTRASTLAK